VKREVWVRDEGRCQFRLESGEICGSTHRLQFDLIRPVALGGKPTVDNLRLACAAPEVSPDY
jgi:5-methylcytosine-specific restriction endonuclease McrA